MTVVEAIDLDREDRRTAIHARLRAIAAEVYEKKHWWTLNTGLVPTRVYLREEDYRWIMENAHEIVVGLPVTGNVARFLGLKMFVSDQPGPYVAANDEDILS